MTRRGEFTDQAKAKMEKFLGRETSESELRLYPYLQYQMMNEQEIDPAKVNGEDRKILKRLRADGHIEGGASGLAMTKEFWDFINNILFDTYVAYHRSWPDWFLKSLKPGALVRS